MAVPGATWDMYMYLHSYIKIKSESYLVVFVGPITFLQWLIASSLASIIGIIGPLYNQHSKSLK